jgi:hypothetical protein
MALTEKQMADRLELIKQISARKKRMEKIYAKGKLVRTYVNDERERAPRVNLTDKYDGENINAWTDASKYAKEHYGEVYHETTRLDNDWD